MIQVPNLVEKLETEPGFNIISFAFTVFLMLSFVGAIIYVLINSLL